ncbi:zinc finger protein 660-like [Paralichthys olivaceus]|uniref:zinc finger protein 660-like n=1 Tax=Paralichthys olivaceus TaxID=8255 RepID=UPI00097CEDBF|nr:PREDICTED: zinc finger protein 660-like [Paralichthys olivaceus]XP_019962564.1 PREDICTED: zinc finger protein 660-like [Paralichthys olivaceus]
MPNCLVTGFRTKLNTALESVLSTAVCEIMSIFESSLHDHQMELAHKGEEVAHLKIKLQTAEIKLKEYEVGADREVEINETETNIRKLNQREPEAVGNPCGQTADAPEIDIGVPDDWCAPLGDETTTKRDDVCPSVRLRQVLIPLCRIPVIKQEVVNTDPPQQEHGLRRSVRGTSSEKHTQTIILPVYNQETQPQSQTSDKKKLPQGLKPDNHDKTASVGVRRGRRQLKEKGQTCTVTSSREERKNTTETTEQETVENGARIYTCNLCSKTFNTEFGQRVHARSHMCCRGCRKVFPFPCDMKSHKRLCKKLKKVLANESQRRKREKLLLTSKKDGSNKMYSCPCCMKKSSSKGKLMQHIHSHTIEKPFACSVCQKKFHVNDVLQKHMTKKHQDKMKPAETNGDLAWTMPLEDIEGDSVSPSKDSSSTVSSNNVKKGPSQGWKTMGVQTTEGYACLKCKKLISNKWLLIEHYRIHTGERPIKCKGCPERFRSCQQLYLHKKKCSYYKTTTQSAEGQP